MKELKKVKGRRLYSNTLPRQIFKNRGIQKKEEKGCEIIKMKEFLRKDHTEDKLSKHLDEMK